MSNDYESKHYPVSTDEMLQQKHDKISELHEENKQLKEDIEGIREKMQEAIEVLNDSPQSRARKLEEQVQRLESEIEYLRRGIAWVKNEAGNPRFDRYIDSWGTLKAKLQNIQLGRWPTEEDKKATDTDRKSSWDDRSRWEAQ